MGAAPLPLARRGSRPRRPGGALLRPLQSIPHPRAQGPPSHFPSWANPGSLSGRFCSEKSLRGAPQSWREASPASHSRAQGARDERALHGATPARGSCLCWPRPEPPGHGDRLCVPHGIFWKGRGSSQGRVGGRQRDPSWPQCLLFPGACPGSPAGGARMGKWPRSQATSSRRPLSCVSCVSAS